MFSGVCTLNCCCCSSVTKLCLTLCNIMDNSMPGFPVLRYLPICLNSCSLVAQLVKNPPTMQKTPYGFLGREDPLEKGEATHSSILGHPWWLSWLRICPQCRSLRSIPELGRSPGEGKDYSLQYSGLENSMDCIVCGVHKE